MPVVQVLAFFYRGRKQSNLSSFKIGCKGTTKNAHTQAKRTLFSKKIDLSIGNFLKPRAQKIQHNMLYINHLQAKTGGGDFHLHM
jgi:hypothetical protein